MLTFLLSELHWQC